MKVAIQGVKACFHDVAARKYFSNQNFKQVECATFPILCSELAKKNADFAVMAIENSIAGSILPNYSLLEKNGFKIRGEVFLKIEMALLGLPGQKINDLEVIQSHPMALFQCEDFLLKYPKVRLLEGTDTAESAKNISVNQLKNHAAIASELAAETYNLEVLARGIETDKKNYTRFLVISCSEDFKVNSKANKASIRFETVHQPGSLVRVLEVFNQLSLNMTKLQSVPLLGRPYQYSFHVDLEWDSIEQYQEAIVLIEKTVVNLIQFGEYEKGAKPAL